MHTHVFDKLDSKERRWTQASREALAVAVITHTVGLRAIAASSVLWVKFTRSPPLQNGDKDPLPPAPQAAVGKDACGSLYFSVTSVTAAASRHSHGSGKERPAGALPEGFLEEEEGLTWSLGCWDPLPTFPICSRTSDCRGQ